MSIHSVVSGVPVNNNGGVGFGIRHASNVLGSVNLGTTVPKTGSVVIDGDDTGPILSGGIFGYNNARPVAKRLTTSLAGVSNTFLLSGAAKPDLIDSVHKLEEITTRRTATAIRAGYWNQYSGSWSTNPTNASDSFNADNAARVTRQSPGSLTYSLGNPLSVVTSEYDDKTG